MKTKTLFEQSKKAHQNLHPQTKRYAETSTKTTLATFLNSDTQNSIFDMPSSIALILLWKRQVSSKRRFNEWMEIYLNLSICDVEKIKSRM